MREGIVICPICGGPLSEISRSFRCPRNHTFDRAREGYVHLLPTGHGRSKIRGDTAEMVRARRRFLARGYYEPLTAAVVGRVMSIQREGLTVVDVGCGEGHAIGRVWAALEPHARDLRPCLIGVDISRDALRLAARTYKNVLFLINDIGHRICVADGSVDVLLDLFAPRNPVEFGRIVRPGGLAVVAIPAEGHLKELRSELPLLGIEEEKRERTIERLRPFFELAEEERFEYARVLDADAVRDLLRMTPNYWHLNDAVLGALASTEPRPVTFGFILLSLRRTDVIAG